MAGFAYYVLSFLPSSETPDMENVFDLLEDMAGIAVFEFEDQSKIRTIDAEKWYDHEEHLSIISELYPSTVFTLIADEEGGTGFVKFFQNGQVQRTDGDMSFDEFDPAQLEAV